ncbi:hypothetical protein GCM10018953_33130 [Streptosporangium nondiastaticum]|uniref:outer membrane protein assembly factor BamB family protein n=1 Tax=Streptosporangium nondiastaticum TaxID=35764 RepID=UPI0031F8F590
MTDDRNVPQGWPHPPQQAGGYGGQPGAPGAPAPWPQGASPYPPQQTGGHGGQPYPLSQAHPQPGAPYPPGPPQGGPYPQDPGSYPQGPGSYPQGPGSYPQGPGGYDPGPGGSQPGGARPQGTPYPPGRPQGGQPYPQPGAPYQPGPPQGPGAYPQPDPGPYQAPQPQGAHPAPPPAGRRTGRTVLFVALGLVALIGIGAGTAWFVSGGFGAGEELRAGDWQVPFTTAGTEVIGTDASIAFGAWMSDTAVVRAQKDGVLAYDLKTGKRVWGTPAPGAQLCGAAPGIVGGRGVVAYGTTLKVCNHLAGIDAKTGKLLWKTTIPAKASGANMKSIETPGLMLAGDLAIVRTAGQVSAYNPADGKKMWTSAPSQACSTEDAAASPRQVVVTLRCMQGGARVVVLDARTGQYRGEHRIADDYGVPDALISADPPLAVWSGGDRATILVLDGKGGKLRQFETDEKVDLLKLNGTIYIEGGHRELRTAVRGDTLYLATFPVNTEGGGISRDDVVAFDLKTGRKLWKSSGTGANMLTFVDTGTAGDKGLLVMEEGGRNEPAPRLTRIDPATGKATPAAELPQKAGGESRDAHIYYRGDTLVIMPFQSITARSAVTVLRVEAE